MVEAAPGGIDGEPPKAPRMSMLGRLGTNISSAAGACLQTLARPEAGTLIFALVCFAIVYRKEMKKGKPRPQAPTLHRSVSMAVLHGGKAVVERIIDAQEARHDGQAVADGALVEMRQLLDEQRMSFTKLNRVASKLEMGGREDEAIKLLQEAHKKAEKDVKPHEAYELQMLLVEMLIYKGEYQQALGCKCLKEKEVSDARRPLYQAIIHTILGNKDLAKDCYKEFQEVRSRFHLPETLNEGSRLYHAVHELDEFEKLVNNLKKEIEHAHRVKANT